MHAAAQAYDLLGLVRPLDAGEARVRSHEAADLVRGVHMPSPPRYERRQIAVQSILALVCIDDVYSEGMLARLEGFVAIAEHGQLGRAASALHLTQPSLTARLQRLEAELGTPLYPAARDRAWC